MLKTRTTTALALSLAFTGALLARQHRTPSGLEAYAQATGGELAAPAGRRAQALRACNNEVDSLKDYTWGQTQSARYRSCMAARGQAE